MIPTYIRYIHTYIHTYIHIYIHIYIHTYIHGSVEKGSLEFIDLCTQAKAPLYSLDGPARALCRLLLWVICFIYAVNMPLMCVCVCVWISPVPSFIELISSVGRCSCRCWNYHRSSENRDHQRLGSSKMRLHNRFTHTHIGIHGHHFLSWCR